MPAFTICIEQVFHAGHYLRFAAGPCEEPHWHDWKVRVTVGRDGLDGDGLVMDFHDLEARVAGIVAPWAGKMLNDVPAFARVNPSAENVAMHIRESLSLPGEVRLVGVEVWETPGCVACCRGDR